MACLRFLGPLLVYMLYVYVIQSSKHDNQTFRDITERAFYWFMYQIWTECKYTRLLFKAILKVHKTVYTEAVRGKKALLQMLSVISKLGTVALPVFINRLFDRVWLSKKGHPHDRAVTASRGMRGRSCSEPCWYGWQIGIKRWWCVVWFWSKLIELRIMLPETSPFKYKASKPCNYLPKQISLGVKAR